MSRRIPLEKWFLNDASQLMWAAEYLLKKGDWKFSETVARGYLSALHELQSFERDERGREILRRMRDAWRQRQSKLRAERKIYSFTLTKDAADGLGILAIREELAKNHCLEWLIKDELAGVRKLKRELAAENKKKRTVQQAKLRLAMPPELRKALAETKALKAANAEWINIVEELAFELCQTNALIKAKGLGEVRLDSMQAIGAKRDADDLVKFYSKKVRGVLTKAKKQTTDAIDEVGDIEADGYIPPEQ